MTVSSSINRVDYNGDGATTAFTVPFRFLDNADLLVISTVVATSVQTTLALTTDYTLSGAGNPTGTLTAVVAPAVGTKLSILRNVAATQTVDYTANDPFPAETHERALDKLTMISQQLSEANNRNVRVQESETSGVVLPGIATRAGKYLAFDGSGLPIATTGTSTTPAISAAMGPVVGAATVLAGFNLLAASGGTVAGDLTILTKNAGTNSTLAASTAYVDRYLRASFAATASGGVTQIIASGADRLLAFNTEIADPSSAYDNTATNYKFTAPLAGTYEFTCFVTTPLTSGNNYVIRLYKNGSLNTQFGVNATLVAANFPLIQTTSIQLAVNDTVQAYFFQDSGSDKTITLGQFTGKFTLP